MAYMNQERKAQIAAEIKKVIPAGWKYTLAVRNHSTIVLNISQAPIDLLENARQADAKKGFGGPSHIGSYLQVNTHSIERSFMGEALDVMTKLNAALNLEGTPQANWDKSDVQTDYFNVGWYVDINIGRYNDPFIHVLPAPAKPARAPKAIGSAPTFVEDPEAYAAMSPGKKAAYTKRMRAQQAQFA